MYPSAGGASEIINIRNINSQQKWIYKQESALNLANQIRSNFELII